MQRKPMSESAPCTYLEKIHGLMIDRLYELFGRIGIHDTLAYLRRVLLGIEEQDGIRRFSVPPSTSGFLVLRLEMGRQVIMDDEPHVGFVDTHTEGVGRHDDTGVSSCPCR